MAVDNLWVGEPTPTSVWVRGKVDGTTVRLAVATDVNLAAPTFYGPTSPTGQGVVSIWATGLDPGTQYHFAFEVDETIDTGWQGQFRTAPVARVPADFTFASWSCAGNSDGAEHTTDKVSNHPAHDSIRNHDPDLIVHLGDLHYRDISDNAPSLFREAYDDVLTYNGVEGADARQGRLYRSVPITYIWDDHDYGPNDSDKHSQSRPAAQQVYRERVPHFPLPDSAGIWQTFAYGRVRFILTDVRSERDSQNATDDATKRMLGEDQEQWLFDLLAAAREPVICWANAVPWIADVVAGADHWGSYSTERARIADFIESVPGLSDRLFIVAGDMHALAIDDGRNNAWGGFPVFQFASTDANGSTKGGPYWKGPTSGRDRYGLVTIVDDGETVTVAGVGYIGASAWDSHSFQVDAPPPMRGRGGPVFPRGRDGGLDLVTGPA